MLYIVFSSIGILLIKIGENQNSFVNLILTVIGVLAIILGYEIGTENEL